jgi:ribA/ribD-fused uncharacterized protein
MLQTQVCATVAGVAVVGLQPKRQFVVCSAVGVRGLMLVSVYRTRSTAPALRARMGRDRKRPLRRDWESVKDAVMREAVLAEFTQHEDLRKLLLDTGDSKLVEHTTNDNYWGDGGDGSGRNMPGIILMETRATLRKE